MPPWLNTPSLPDIIAPVEVTVDPPEPARLLIPLPATERTPVDMTEDEVAPSLATPSESIPNVTIAPVEVMELEDVALCDNMPCADAPSVEIAAVTVTVLDPPRELLETPTALSPVVVML